MKNVQLILVIASLLITFTSSAQTPHSHEHGRKIEFPDIPDYKTLKCDFHIHSVFSDGTVWPTLRVEEALKDGLDAIAITEHLEYQPHLEDIPHPDRNRSFEITKQFATAFDVIIIPGVEITRSMPPGHSNAIFVKDANKIKVDDPIESYREAARQGGFIFMNHANWIAQRSDGIARLDDMHKQLIEEDLIHGIEVVNDLTYSDEAVQIALDNNLVIIGTSDIHGLVDWQYKIAEGGHRPISLVFAEERTAESIEEAVKAGRTVAWFNNLLIGKQEFLVPLIENSLQIKEAMYIGTSQVLEIEIENVSGATYLLDNNSDYTFHNFGKAVTIPAHETIKLQVKTKVDLESIEIPFTVMNAQAAPKTYPMINLKTTISQ